MVSSDNMAAKLHLPLLFCNSINLKTLINIAKYDDQHVLITCKSCIKRINLIDRKQVNSWVTKSWYPFTAGAVNDLSKDHIYAVINNNSLNQWTLDMEDVGNFAKHTFKSEIKTLSSTKHEVYIIYNFGFVEPLNVGLKRRKETKKEIVSRNESITKFKIYEKTKDVALLTEKMNGEITLYKLKIGSEEIYYSCKLQILSFSLTGSLFLSSGKLLTLWSNGQLYGSDILNGEPILNSRCLRGHLTSLKPTKKTVILELASNHIVVQGMNANEEGGIILLYDTKFGVCIDTKPMKMYRDPPLGWSVGASGVVVGDGGSLVYVPATLSPSTVASILGSRLQDKSKTHDFCLGWVSPSSGGGRSETKEIPLSALETVQSNISPELTSLLKDTRLGGLSEDVVVDCVVKNLIETRNLKLINECLNKFGFILERNLVSLLKLLLELPDNNFREEPLVSPKSSTQSKSKMSVSSLSKQSYDEGTSEGINQKGSISNGNQDHHTLSVTEVICPFSPSKCTAINKILQKPFTAVHLSKALSSLNFQCSLTLIQYLHFLLVAGEAQLTKKSSSLPTIEKTSCWLSLLLDRNYHQLVMTSEVEIHRTLLSIFSDVNSLHSFLEAFLSIDPLVDRIISSKFMPVTQVDSPYSIEKLII